MQTPLPDADASNVKKGRIIIRNLVFDISEKHLTSLFQKFGKITEIKIPVNPANNRSKGFGFVQFENKNSALNAIKSLNETSYKGRTILLDFSVDTRTYQAFQKDNQKENKSEGLENKEGDEEGNEGESDELEQDNEDDQEDISEEEFKEPVKRSQSKDQNKEKQNKYDVYIQIYIFNNIKDSDMTDTIFVRSIPYNTTEVELKKFFTRFGEIEYAKVKIILQKLVINKITNENNGTGFIKFKAKEVAQQLIDKSNVTANSLRNRNVINELEMNGRLLIVLPALQRDNIPLKQEKVDKTKINLKKTNKLSDLILFDSHQKRNLYLSEIGFYQPEKHLTEKENQKLEAHYNEKVQKLKNSNMYVSKTRVMLKNIPKSLDEDDIKAILNTFAESKKIKQQKIVKQVVVLREKEKTDKETGELQSKGISFMEFSTHENASDFITYILSNHKTIFKQRPIVEFAIEDARFQKKRMDIKESQKLKKEQDSNAPKEQTETQRDQEKKESKTNYNLIKQMMKKEDFRKDEMKNLLKGIRLRGLRQRVKSQIEKVKGEDFFEKKVVIIKKKLPEVQDKQEKKLKEKKQRLPVEDAESKSESLQLKVFAKDYTKKLQKKLKWDMNLENAVIL